MIDKKHCKLTKSFSIQQIFYRFFALCNTVSSVSLCLKNHINTERDIEKHKKTCIFVAKFSYELGWTIRFDPPRKQIFLLY